MKGQSVFALGLFVLSLTVLPSGVHAAVSVQASRIGDATHIEFRGGSEWNYVLKRDDKDDSRVILRVPQLTKEAADKLRALNDPLITSVKINAQSVDNAYEVQFQVSPQADFFDYITDHPSRLIVDFFPREAKEAKPAVKPVEKLPEKKSSTAKIDKKSATRTPAGSDLVLTVKSELPAAPSKAEIISSKKDFSHGIFDGGDPEFERFSVKNYEINEDAVIASRANFYLPFPMLDLGVPQLGTLLSVSPSYEIVANETQENKEARVILRLFAEKQRALFLKTAKQFLVDYPNSRYDEIVRYMVADAHYDIWRGSGSYQDFDAAMNHYLAMTEKYPESPMTSRTLLLMGYSYLDRGDSFGALKVFERFMRLSPGSKQMDRVRISVADAYLKLNRFDDAFKLLDQVEKQGLSPRGRQEAAYRKGDIFFRKKDYREAIQQYQGALARYPEVATRYPNAWYNIAESEFTLGRYRESIDAYRTFLQKFPDHEYGGYAMTRIGELFGIFGVAPERSIGAFRESYFRYRATSGAGIARIRMLTSRMSEMKPKELESGLREIEDITHRYATRAETPEEAKAKEEITSLTPQEGNDPTRRRQELPGIEEFSKLLIADGFSERKEYDTAARELIDYYRKNPVSPNKDRFLNRIVNNVSEGIEAAVERGHFIEALSRYAKNASSWLKNTNRVDVCFNVGRAYEQAGVFKEAAKVYADCLTRSTAVKDKETERRRNIFEKPPGADKIRLRMAAVEAKDGKYAEAESLLKKLPEKPNLSEEEQIERAEIAAQIAEMRGQPKVARKYLEELLGVWKGNKQLTSPLRLRIARLQIAEGDFKSADTHLATIMNWKKEDQKMSDDVLATAMEMRGDLFVKRGQRSEAAETYRGLLDAYESSRPLASVRYRLGQLLYQDGDLKSAESVWAGLNAEEQGNIWQKLAVEQMESAKWRNEYKKYLERIPAAVELRNEKASSTTK